MRTDLERHRGDGLDRAIGAPLTSASPSKQAEAFPTEAFAHISEDRVSRDAAAKFQAILDDMAGKRGMSATMMSPAGTWSGATGKADGVRDVRVDDQFAIASITKSMVAAQVMQMVEAGELDLDDPAADHLPADLDFDTNGGDHPPSAGPPQRHLPRRLR
jgi:D-alanyl-D-alanine carboxypeptidase